MRRRHWLGAALLATAATAAARPARASPADDAVHRGRELRFARDHGAHLAAATEWWYLTGELRPVAAQGSGAGAAAALRDDRFGFQITFFRSRTGLAKDLSSRFAARHVLFAHAALSDIAGARHHHAQRIARWSGDPGAALARASLQDTDVLIGDWWLRRHGADNAAAPSVYRTHFGGGDAASPFVLQLELRAALPPLLQGDAGFSRKGPDEAQASHYVSEPQLRAHGSLRRGGVDVALRGRAWLDHEWSDALLHPQALGWDWIGMNLDDGSALTAFQLRRADGTRLWAGGSWRDAAGRSMSFDPGRVQFTPGRVWTSPATGARYPLQWRLDTPAGRFEVRALLEAQELDSRASSGTVYWEGLSELLDAQAQRVGSGYLEMTGYAGRLRLGE